MLKKLSTLSMHVALLALVVAVGAWWVVKIATPAPVAAPPPPRAAVAREAAPAMAARMFGLVQAAPTGVSNIQVLGVFAAGRNSSAVIAADGKPARVVLVGQPVGAGMRLVAVSRDGITVDRNGAPQELRMPPRPLPEPAKSAPAAAGFTRDGNTLSAPGRATASAAAPVTAAGAAPAPGAAPAAPPPMLQAVPTQPAVSTPPPAPLPAAGAAAPTVAPTIADGVPHAAPRGRAARRGRSSESDD